MEAPDEARAPKVAAESWLDRKAGPELESALPLLTGFPNRVPKRKKCLDFLLYKVVKF